MKIQGNVILVVLAGCLFMASLASTQAADDVVVYQPYSLDRYKLLFERFPFGKEHVVQATPPPTQQKPGFADDLQLTGHFKMGSTIYVNILNRRSQERMTLNSAEGDSNRIKVLSLLEDQDPYNVKVVIQLSGETASLSFDRPAPPKSAVGASNTPNALSGNLQSPLPNLTPTH